MSSIHSRPVDPMSLLIDVFVALERLRHDLEALRDDIVLQSGAATPRRAVGCPAQLPQDR